MVKLWQCFLGAVLFKLLYCHWVDSRASLKKSHWFHPRRDGREGWPKQVGCLFCPFAFYLNSSDTFFFPPFGTLTLKPPISPLSGCNTLEGKELSLCFPWFKGWNDRDLMLCNCFPLILLFPLSSSSLLLSFLFTHVSNSFLYLE